MLVDPNPRLPRVLADLPVSPAIERLLAGRVELLPWHTAQEGEARSIAGIYTYGHPRVDAAMLDHLPEVRVISNFGVGVDHIDVSAAMARGIAVGNTPGILDGATADLAFALLLAAGRRLVEGDRYARGPNFLSYDPSFMLGREVHGSTLGILGMGRIGEQVARRARAFDMHIFYHNRQRRPAVEEALGARYVTRDELLAAADYVVLTVPLTSQTHRLIGRAELARMKPTAILINVSRGAVVDTEALTEALKARTIYAAALDVTEPEPLPRDHPLLRLDNVIITPHLGSATDQTRQRMAEVSVENLFAGLSGHPLPCPVVAGLPAK
ncbi:MAG TPA: D-glycerate dehydrogenase [Gemmataceae bacterium]|nr:D-glycerate dehydrogenase [Gemmataceae bacterium]